MVEMINSAFLAGSRASQQGYEIAFVFIQARDTGRLLAQQRADNRLWSIPGGTVENGELPAQGAVRETDEETGLSLSVEQLVPIDFFDDRHGRRCSIFYAVIDEEFHPHEDDESLGYLWVLPHQWPQPCHEKIPQQLTQLQAHLGSVAMPALRFVG